MTAQAPHITPADSAASYIGSLPGICGCDTAFAASPAATTIAVPAAGTVMARPVSPLHSTGAIALLLAVFLFIALNYKKGYKYFSHISNHLFSVRRRHNTFDDHTSSETYMMLSLLALTCAMGGIVLYLAIGHLYPALLAGSDQVGKYIWALTGYSALLVASQYLLYRIMGYTFLPDKESTRLLVDGFNASQALLGLLLLPVAFTMLLLPSSLHAMLYVAATVYLVARIVFVSKGFRIFFNNLASLLYFILYLCSVEIVPVFLSFSGAIFLCNLLHS